MHLPVRVWRLAVGPRPLVKAWLVERVRGKSRRRLVCRLLIGVVGSVPVVYCRGWGCRLN